MRLTNITKMVDKRRALNKFRTSRDQSLVSALKVTIRALNNVDQMNIKLFLPELHIFRDLQRKNLAFEFNLQVFICLKSRRLLSAYRT